jgi:hypothetical protein
MCGRGIGAQDGPFGAEAMMSRSFTYAILGAGLAAVLLPAAARAQVGTGWNEYMPGRTLQIRGCGAHGGDSGGVETFGLTCSSTSGDNRAEDRMQNDYTSGTRQFQGEVRVVSLGGTNVSLKQTFMRDNGAFLMIGVSMIGRLYSVGDNGELATDVIGRWVRINTVHDVGAGTVQIWIDGVLKVTKTGGRQVAWYDKYGSYRLGSGHGPISVEWRNTRFWRDGRSEGGAPQPAADAGAVDPAPRDAAAADRANPPGDLAPEPEPATPDAAPGATGGAPGNSGGTGGSPGTPTGGRTGTTTGGSSGSSEENPDADDGEPTKKPARGGGCSLGGDSPGGLLLLLALLALRRYRR